MGDLTLTDSEQRQLQIVVGSLHHLLGRAHLILARGRITSTDEEEALSLLESISDWWKHRAALSTTLQQEGSEGG